MNAADDDDGDVVISAAEVMARHSTGVCSGASLLYIHRSYSPQVCRQMSRKCTHRWQINALYASACSGLTA